MKLLTALICIVFYANSVSANGIRVKRGVNAVQQKFVDALNEDRKRLAEDLRFRYVPLTYNDNLSERIDPSPPDCVTALRRPKLPLKENKVAQELNELNKKGREGDIYYPYFYPMYTKIGCSKTFKCSEKITGDKKGFDAPETFIGKTVEYYGMCYLYGDDSKENRSVRNKLKRAKLPSPSKYGDILGVVGPVESSGRASGIVYPIFLSLVLVFFI